MSYELNKIDVVSHDLLLLTNIKRQRFQADLWGSGELKIIR